MNISGITYRPISQPLDTSSGQVSGTPCGAGDISALKSQLPFLMDKTDLPNELAGDLYLDSLFQDSAPIAQLSKEFSHLASEYGVKPPMGKDTLRMAIISAEPYLNKLCDNASESEVNDALSTGMKIALLKDWLMREEGMSSFPAMLKAVELEGCLPDSGDTNRNLEIICG